MFKTVRELIDECSESQTRIDRYKINSWTYGVKIYDFSNDIPEQELNLGLLWCGIRGYKDECGIRCRELEIFCG